ncbi:MAG: fibronectin type III domain-containing protein, partial [Thermoplasmata archaeon]|nr:fibronectin type III domain-containing protein [Thermoplasmata archaeon]
YWYENSTGSWVLQQTNSSVSSGSTVYWTYINATGYDTEYWWKIEVSDGTDTTSATYKFTTRSQYIPGSPTGFSATTVSATQIDLSWTKGTNADYTYIERNTVSNWNRGDGAFVCNITGTSYSDTGLNPHTTYYYQAWSYNITDNAYSTNYATASNTTKNTAPTISNENPTNDSTDIDLQPTCHVDVSDSDGNTLTVYWYENTTTGSWVLRQTNNSVSSGSTVYWAYTQANSYATKYWWKVEVTDGTDTTTAIYHFTTITNNPPILGTPSPANGSTNQPLSLTWSITINDPEGDTFNWTIECSNGQSNSGTNGVNGTKSLSLSGLSYSTNYTVWVNTTDSGSGEWTNATYWFITSTTGSSGSSGTSSEEKQQQEEEEQSTQSTNVSSTDDILNELNNTLNIELEKPFYANDTDGDGKVDNFVDPNGQLKLINITTIGNASAFLISADGDEIPEFFWNPSNNSITTVKHSVPTSSSICVDKENEKVTITVSINKTGWVYIVVDDAYPEYDVTVKTSDGRIISADKIWRKDGKIYVFDDPDVEYYFIYSYTILPPTFNPQSGMTFTTAKPTITITYSENVTVIQSTLNENPISLTSPDNMIFTYTPESNLTNGDYLLEITVRDNENNTRTDAATFTIAVASPEESEEQPLGTSWVIVIVVVAMVVLVILGLLVKAGILYLERRRPPKR